MSIKIAAELATEWRRIVKNLCPDPTNLPRTIDERLARDIGMSKVEFERHRFTWPSQSADHPKL